MLTVQGRTHFQVQKMHTNKIHDIDWMVKLFIIQLKGIFLTQNNINFYDYETFNIYNTFTLFQFHHHRNITRKNSQ